jgi:peroxiredoxin
MKKQFFLFCVIAVLFALSSFTFIEKDKSISNFKLKSATTNKWVSLSDYKDAKGFIVIFTCNKCPMAKFYSQRLNQMNEKYKKMGVPLVTLNSMDTLAYAEESFHKMQLKVKKEQLNFPYLQDKKQNVAKEFKAANTPQAFVIWKVKGKYAIQYEGAIDDNAGDTDKVKNHFLTDAVDQLLEGNEVKVPKSESFGCKIFYRGVEDKMK